MPSQARATYLEALLLDSEELSKAHTRLRTGARGRQWGLGAINRAAVVVCVSAWEAYVEELVKEALVVMQPQTGPTGAWAPLNAITQSEIKRFNTPNVENTIKLFSTCLGLPDVTAQWGWRNCDRVRAREHLNDAIQQRHRIAHGVNPRPTIHNHYSGWLPDLFRNLGACTDASVRDHLRALGYSVPQW